MSGYVLLPELFGTREAGRLRDVAEQVHGATAGRFVAKLNFKRAGVGSEFAWHQDFPYWYGCCGAAAYDVATAIVIHRSAPNRTRSDRRFLLHCFRPEGRPQLPALHYIPERLAALP